MLWLSQAGAPAPPTCCDVVIQTTGGDKAGFARSTSRGDPSERKVGRKHSRSGSDTCGARGT
jgi:hypothetical protein